MKGTGLLERTHFSRTIFLLSLLVFAFYLTGTVLIKNVYQYALVGAVYEMVWMPMLLLLVAIPVLAIIWLVRNRQASPMYAIGSMVFIATTVVLMVVN